MVEKDQRVKSDDEVSRSVGRPFFVVIMVVFCVLLIEGSSFAFLAGYFRPRNPDLFRRDYSSYIADIPDSYFSRFSDSFDPDLGWDTVPNKQHSPRENCAGQLWSHGFDAQGSRNNPHDSNDVLISLYGGSYTLAQEVDDDQTWQHRLSVLTDTKVLNFGVGGYGPDQAILKLKRNLRRGIRTPIVVLGLYSSGIGRIVNAFRPYFYPSTGIKLGFKPILMEQNGRYEWIGVPVNSVNDRAAVERAARSVRSHDYWYQHNALKPRMGFPYSLTLLHSLYFLTAHQIPNRNLWLNSPIATGTMSELIRQFVELGRREGFMPVVVFLPEIRDLDRYAEGLPPRYDQFKTGLIKAYDAGQVIIADVYDERFDHEKFMTKAGCHASTYGNRITADAVYRAITPLFDDLKFR